MRPSQIFALALLCAAGCSAHAQDRAASAPRPVGPRAGAPAASPFTSASACEALPPAPREAGRARIATWNVRWFPDGSPGAHDAALITDVEWLACAIASLRVDAIALQEILLHERGRAALDRLRASLDRRTGGRWTAHDDGCAAGNQHLVFLVDRSRVEVVRAEAIAALHPIPEARNACAHRLRPGLLARLRFRGGLDVSAITLHLDSGTEQRDHDHRRVSLAALPAAIAALPEGADDVIVLGDLNSMGCHRCASPVSLDAELAVLDAELSAAELRLVPPTQRCSEYSGSHASPLDHVAVSRATAELPRGARAEVHGPCAMLSCRHAPRDPLPAALATLSDHCPIVIELEDRDAD